MILLQFDLLPAIVNESLRRVGHIRSARLKRFEKDGQAISLLHLLILWVIDGVDFFDLHIDRHWISLIITIDIRIELTILLLDMQSDALHLESVIGEAVNER